MKQKNGS